MGKVSYHFFTALFNSVLIYIILINYTGWSGAWLDIVGTTSTRSWADSYFGFQSLQLMLSDANNLFQNSQMSVYKILDDLNKLLYVITFGLPNALSKLVVGNFGVNDFLRLIANLLLQPLFLTYYVVKIIAYLVVYVIFFITLLMKAFSGQYNIPFDNIPDYHPSSLVIPPVLASGFML